MKFEPQSKFTVDQIEDLLKNGSGTPQKLNISLTAKRRLLRARAQVEKLKESGDAIYGVNTGFGRLARIKISKDELESLQINLIRSHACGVGKPLSEKMVRRLLLLRLLSLGKAASGIRIQTFQRHLDFWNRSLTPWIPEQGSVGASGDLAPLAHLALPMLGEGHFLMGCEKVPASGVLKKLKLAPLQIGAKEGLSLTNGTQVSLALGLEALSRIKHLWKWMEAITCLSVEAHSATATVYDEAIHALKAHPEQREIAANLRRRLKSSDHMKAHHDCGEVQDSYSFRAVPQILAPCLKFIRTAEELMENEVNSVSDNPVFVKGSNDLHSCGHFHAQAVSMASDLITQAAVTMGNLSERRLDQLVNPLTTRTTGFLAQQPGVESGLMIVQTSAAALASENKTLAFPASADTISTNGNQEDHVSMAPWAGRKSLHVLENLESILVMEMVGAVRGCVIESTRSGLTFSTFVERFLAWLGKKSPSIFKAGDRVFADDFEILKALIKSSAPPDELK